MKVFFIFQNEWKCSGKWVKKVLAIIWKITRVYCKIYIYKIFGQHLAALRDYSCSEHRNYSWQGWWNIRFWELNSNRVLQGKCAIHCTIAQAPIAIILYIFSCLMFTCFAYMKAWRWYLIQRETKESSNCYFTHYLWSTTLFIWGFAFVCIGATPRFVQGLLLVYAQGSLLADHTDFQNWYWFEYVQEKYLIHGTISLVLYHLFEKIEILRWLQQTSNILVPP